MSSADATSPASAPATRASVLIVGAGLTGSLLACLLGEAGWEVELVERRADPRVGPPQAGRSINLAISARGLQALRRAGLEAAVLAQAVRMPGRIIHDRAGRTQFQPYSAGQRHAINSINRGVLNRLLAERAAACPSVRLAFDERCVAVDMNRPSASFRHEATGAMREVSADLVVATDGAYSVIRDSMQKREQFEYSQEWLHAGYKELTMAPAEDANDAWENEGRWRMDPNGLHIWPRGESMMIALANAEGSFTCTLFWPHEGLHSFNSLAGDASIRARLERDYPDVLALIPDAVEQYRANHVGHMVTVKCSPWHVNGKVALLGDAAHAIVPFFGQGANCGFEDCEALADSLFECGGDWHAALDRYQELRKRHADAIADLARQNFHEMSHHTATLRYKLRKQVDHLMHRLMPRVWIPLYEMISFTTIPYDDARERAARQWRWLWFGAGVVVGLVGLGAAAAYLVARKG
ncbi:MAG: NAD(P)/FAD-dependent oxidoreductase [Planctomycetota bacterium]|nr:NAD(P)/FAD-dependent oxidoreductase [Planctomycetota bacterium]MDA1105866.1 NAD(P)/FAD-dependent oxidoreductase [Planctomycetota bacterium]